MLRVLLSCAKAEAGIKAVAANAASTDFEIRFMVCIPW